MFDLSILSAFGLPAIAVAVVGFVLFFVFRKGKQDATQERAAKDKQAVDKARSIERTVDARDPQENRERLKKW